jgi:hypothetical protein
VDHQKLEAVFPREVGKLAAGVRHAVNFAVGAGKQRDSEIAARHAMTS